MIRSGLLLNHLAVFPNDHWKPEPLVLGTQLTGGTAMRTKGKPGKFRKLAFLLMR